MGVGMGCADTGILSVSSTESPGRRGQPVQGLKTAVASLWLLLLPSFIAMLSSLAFPSTSP